MGLSRICIGTAVMFSFFLLSSLLVPLVFGSSVMWSQTYGDLGGDHGRSVIEGSDGGFIIAGYSNSFNNKTYDSWLIKTDIHGNIEWNQTYGPGILQEVILTSDGGYAFCGSNRLVKSDSQGNLQWNRTYGPSSFSSLLETSDGGYAIAGGTHSFEDGSDDFLLIKVDANGDPVWNKTYNNGVDETAYSLVMTIDGGYALVGVTGFDEVDEMSDMSPSFNSSSDIWLVKTDTFGNLLWNQTFDFKANEIAYSLVQINDNGYAIVGTVDQYDVLLVKTNINGEKEWYKKFGGDFDDKAFSLIETSDLGLAIAGTSNSYGAGSLDFWIIKTDTNGNIQWTQTHGGEKWDMARSLIETSDGGYALVGETYSFGAGDSDFFLIKTDNMGNIPEFFSCIIFPILLISTLVAITLRNKIRSKGLL